MRSRRRNEVREEELAAFADGTLAPERRTALEEHIAASADLADRLAEQERAVGLVRAAVADTEAPAGLRARIEARRRVPPARAGGRLVLVGAAAAATATVALVFAVGSGTSHQQFDAVLGSPQGGSTAQGEATLTQTDAGWRIELDATGLPRLAAGRFYEAWLKSDDGALVPIGTFNEPRNVTLWAGVSPEDFPTLTVTRERSDGDQASSGDKVLVGTVDTSG